MLFPCLNAESELLDHQLLGPVITSKLSLIASYSSYNLQHLTVQHLVHSFLPQLLPSDWRAKSEVAWNVAAAAATSDLAATDAADGIGAGASESSVTWWVFSYVRVIDRVIEHTRCTCASLLPMEGPHSAFGCRHCAICTASTADCQKHPLHAVGVAINSLLVSACPLLPFHKSCICSLQGVAASAVAVAVITPE